jgi:hypothetical protein
MTHLIFRLNIEDGWPPVGAESLPIQSLDDNARVIECPLFIKNISSGDILNYTLDSEGYVSEWSHVHKSRNSTVWILKQSANACITSILDKLFKLGCNIIHLSDFGLYAVDINEAVPFSEVELLLDSIDESEFAVAYPSQRHH